MKKSIKFLISILCATLVGALFVSLGSKNDVYAAPATAGSYDTTGYTAFNTMADRADDIHTYTIGSASAFSEFLGCSGGTSEDIFVLTADIDLTDVTAYGSFSGTLNGNGYTISNYTLSTSTTYAYMFDNIGTITNVKFTDITITSSVSSANVALINQMYEGNSLTNVVVTNFKTSTGNSVIGGTSALVASNSGTISDVTVTGSYIAGLTYAAGIAANNSGCINKCYVENSVIYGDVYVGGIAAKNDSSGFISCCSVQNATRIFQGYYSSSKGSLPTGLTNSYDTVVTSSLFSYTSNNVYVGGIAGYCSGTITHSYFLGLDTVSSSNSDIYTNTATINAAGIAGFTDNPGDLKITDSAFFGSIQVNNGKEGSGIDSAYTTAMGSTYSYVTCVSDENSDSLSTLEAKNYYGYGSKFYFDGTEQGGSTSPTSITFDSTTLVEGYASFDAWQTALATNHAKDAPSSYVFYKATYDYGAHAITFTDPVNTAFAFSFSSHALATISLTTESQIFGLSATPGGEIVEYITLASVGDDGRSGVTNPITHPDYYLKYKNFFTNEWELAKTTTSTNYTVLKYFHTPDGEEYPKLEFNYVVFNMTNNIDGSTNWIYGEEFDFHNQYCIRYNPSAYGGNGYFPGSIKLSKDYEDEAVSLTYVRGSRDPEDCSHMAMYELYFDADYTFTFELSEGSHVITYTLGPNSYDLIDPYTIGDYTFTKGEYTGEYKLSITNEMTELPVPFTVGQTFQGMNYGSEATFKVTSVTYYGYDDVPTSLHHNYSVTVNLQVIDVKTYTFKYSVNNESGSSTKTTSDFPLKVVYYNGSENVELTTEYDPYYSLDQSNPEAVKLTFNNAISWSLRLVWSDDWAAHSFNIQNLVFGDNAELSLNEIVIPELKDGDTLVRSAESCHLYYLTDVTDNDGNAVSNEVYPISRAPYDPYSAYTIVLSDEFLTNHSGDILESDDSYYNYLCNGGAITVQLDYTLPTHTVYYRFFVDDTEYFLSIDKTVASESVEETRTIPTNELHTFLTVYAGGDGSSGIWYVESMEFYTDEDFSTEYSDTVLGEENIYVKCSMATVYKHSITGVTLDGETKDLSLLSVRVGNSESPLATVIGARVSYDSELNQFEVNYINDVERAYLWFSFDSGTNYTLGLVVTTSDDEGNSSVNCYTRQITGDTNVTPARTSIITAEGFRSYVNVTTTLGYLSRVKSGISNAEISDGILTIDQRESDTDTIVLESYRVYTVTYAFKDSSGSSVTVNDTSATSQVEEGKTVPFILEVGYYIEASTNSKEIGLIVVEYKDVPDTMPAENITVEVILHEAMTFDNASFTRSGETVSGGYLFVTSQTSMTPVSIKWGYAEHVGLYAMDKEALGNSKIYAYFECNEGYTAFIKEWTKDSTFDSSYDIYKITGNTAEDCYMSSDSPFFLSNTEEYFVGGASFTIKVDLNMGQVPNIDVADDSAVQCEPSKNSVVEFTNVGGDTTLTIGTTTGEWLLNVIYRVTISGTTYEDIEQNSLPYDTDFSSISLPEVGGEHEANESYEEENALVKYSTSAVWWVASIGELEYSSMPAEDIDLVVTLTEMRVTAIQIQDYTGSQLDEAITLSKSNTKIEELDNEDFVRITNSGQYAAKILFDTVINSDIYVWVTMEDGFDAVCVCKLSYTDSTYGSATPTAQQFRIYKVQVSISDSTNINGVTGEGYYLSGTVVTLTATTSSGYKITVQNTPAVMYTCEDNVITISNLNGSAIFYLTAENTYPFVIYQFKITNGENNETSAILDDWKFRTEPGTTIEEQVTVGTYVEITPNTLFTTSDFSNIEWMYVSSIDSHASTMTESNLTITVNVLVGYKTTYEISYDEKYTLETELLVSETDTYAAGWNDAHVLINSEDKYINYTSQYYLFVKITDTSNDEEYLRCFGAMFGYNNLGIAIYNIILVDADETDGVTFTGGGFYLKGNAPVVISATGLEDSQKIVLAASNEDNQVGTTETLEQDKKAKYVDTAEAIKSDITLTITVATITHKQTNHYTLTHADGSVTTYDADYTLNYGVYCGKTNGAGVPLEGVDYLITSEEYAVEGQDTEIRYSDVVLNYTCVERVDTSVSITINDVSQSMVKSRFVISRSNTEAVAIEDAIYNGLAGGTVAVDASLVYDGAKAYLWYTHDGGDHYLYVGELGGSELTKEVYTVSITGASTATFSNAYYYDAGDGVSISYSNVASGYQVSLVEDDDTVEINPDSMAIIISGISKAYELELEIVKRYYTITYSITKYEIDNGTANTSTDSKSFEYESATTEDYTQYAIIDGTPVWMVTQVTLPEGMASFPTTMPANNITITVVGYEVYSAIPTITLDGESFTVTNSNIAIGDETVKYTVADSKIYYSKAAEMSIIYGGASVSVGTLPTDNTLNNELTKTFYYVGIKEEVSGITITGAGYYEAASNAVLTITAEEGMTVATTYNGASIDEEEDTITITSVSERVELVLTITYKTFKIIYMYIDNTDPENPVDLAMTNDPDDETSNVQSVQYSKTIDYSSFATLGAFKSLYTTGEFENWYGFVISYDEDGDEAPTTMPARELTIMVYVKQATVSNYYVNVDGSSIAYADLEFTYSDATATTPEASESLYFYEDATTKTVYYTGEGIVWCQYDSQTINLGTITGESIITKYIYSVSVTKDETLDSKTFEYTTTNVYYVKNTNVTLDFTVPTGYVVACESSDVTVSGDNKITITSISKAIDITVGLDHKSYTITYTFVSSSASGASLYDDKVSLDNIQTVKYTEAITPVYSKDSIIAMYLDGTSKSGLIYDIETVPTTMPAENLTIEVRVELAQTVELSTTANGESYDSSNAAYKFYISESVKTTPTDFHSLVSEGKLYYTKSFYLFITIDEVDYALEAFDYDNPIKTEASYTLHKVSFTLGTGVTLKSGPTYVLDGNSATYEFELAEGYKISMEEDSYEAVNETSFVSNVLKNDVTITVNRTTKTYYIYYYKNKDAYDTYYNDDKNDMASSTNTYGTRSAVKYLAEIGADLQALGAKDNDKKLTAWFDPETSKAIAVVTMPAHDIVLYGSWTTISIVQFSLALYNDGTNGVSEATVRLSSTKDTFTEVTESTDEFYQFEFATGKFNITCGNADQNFIFVMYPGTDEYVYFADADKVSNATTLYNVKGNALDHVSIEGLGWKPEGNLDIEFTPDAGYEVAVTTEGYTITDNVLSILVSIATPTFVFTEAKRTFYIYYYKDAEAKNTYYAADQENMADGKNYYVEAMAVVYDEDITYAAIGTIDTENEKKLASWFDTETNVAVTYEKMPAKNIVLYGNWTDISIFSFNLYLYEDGEDGVVEGTVKLSSTKDTFTEVTSSTDDVYSLSFTSDTNTFKLQCTDDTKAYIYVMYPGTEEYVYFKDADKVKDTTLVHVQGNALEHASIEGLGWKPLGDLDITFTPDAGYEVSCSNVGYTITNNVLSITVTEKTTEFTFVESKRTFYIYYYQNVDAYNTYYETDKNDPTTGENYYVSPAPFEFESEITYASLGTVLDSKKLVSWYDASTDAAVTYETMPASDIVLYGNWKTMAAVDMTLMLYNEGENAVDADTVRLSSTKDTFTEITTATDEYYQFSFDSESSKYSMYCGDEANSFVFVKYPGTEEYVYFADVSTCPDTTTLYNVTANEAEHYSVTGLGWHEAGELVLEFTLEEGYEVKCLNDGYEIYGTTLTIHKVDEKLPKFTFEASLKDYYIFFYMNEKKWRTDTYKFGDTIEWPTPNTGDYVFKGWLNAANELINDTVTTMPSSDITATASLTLTKVNTITLKFESGDAGLLTGSMFFVSESKDEIINRSPAKIEGTKISFEYTGEGYLWITDPVSNTERSLGVTVSGDPTLSFVCVTLSSEANTEHLAIDNLGYILKGYTQIIEVTPETGYGFTVEGYEVKNNTITLPTVDKSIVLNIQEVQEEYSINYYVQDELVHTDTYHYMDKVTMWDKSLYTGSVRFDSWSAVIEDMPDYSINIYAQNIVTYTLVTYPTAAKIHQGQTLAESIITGGLIYIGDDEVQGTFTFVNATYKPTTADSMVTEFDVIFTEASNEYVPYQFTLTLEVCNPVFDASELLEPTLVEATASTIRFAINEKYEYSLDGENYFQGKNVLLKGYKEKEAVTIYYRYQEDDSFCASLVKEVVFHTISIEQINYDKASKEGVDVIDSYQDKIENESAREFMAVMKDKLSLSFDNATLSSEEVSELVEYVNDVLDIMISVEDARGTAQNLDSSRIRSYADHRLDEVAYLATNQVPVEKIEVYKEFVLEVLNVADQLIGMYNVLDKDLQDRFKYNALGDDESLTESEFVVNKVDELLDYNYDSYSYVDLDEYKDEYVGKTVSLMADANASIHSCDGLAVTQTIGKQVAVLQYMTYEDYKFDREAYDEAFWLAAEAAIIVHIQGITLAFADAQLLLIYAKTADAKARALYKELYDALVVTYSDYETFRQMYFDAIGDSGDVLYEDVLVIFQDNVIHALTLPISNSFSEVEILIMVGFSVALAGCLAAAIVIKRRRRLVHAL